MLDGCVVEFRDGTEWDEETGRDEPVWAERFASKCRLQIRGFVSTEDQAGGRGVLITVAELHLPVSAPMVEPADRVTITEIGPYSDPQILGKRLRITGWTGKSLATARRLEVTEEQT